MKPLQESWFEFFPPLDLCIYSLSLPAMQASMANRGLTENCVMPTLMLLMSSLMNISQTAPAANPRTNLKKAVSTSTLMPEKPLILLSVDCLTFAHVNENLAQVQEGVTSLGITHWLMFECFKL
ncbi:hypothetical protein VP01_998g1 [Puccinia sorghi]|uniref:Uncharacterized protein n=1 Tax=Puccinia sorghi TaxID=27349 RepID=A0A0L6U584_9BASI|nr:hypothetical protein VP01_998g1 [Puccinia sorghi]